MASILIRKEDLDECCLRALAEYEGTEKEGDHLNCPDCPKRMRVHNGGWERWFYWDELPPEHPDRQRPKVPVEISTILPLQRSKQYVTPAETEVPGVLKGEKIPFLEGEHIEPDEGEA